MVIVDEGLQLEKKAHPSLLTVVNNVLLDAINCDQSRHSFLLVLRRLGVISTGDV